MEKNKDVRPKMTWVIMDITDMVEFDTDSFDIAIDKSTMDALFCGDDAFTKVSLMLRETQRVLKPGGHCFSISYGKPEVRLFHFERPFLSWQIREFILYENDNEGQPEEDEKSHYIYVAKKNEDANAISHQYFAQTYSKLMVDSEV